MHQARAVSAFQRSPHWTTDVLGAFKPVSCCLTCSALLTPQVGVRQ